MWAIRIKNIGQEAKLVSVRIDGGPRVPARFSTKADATMAMLIVDDLRCDSALEDIEVVELD